MFDELNENHPAASQRLFETLGRSVSEARKVEHGTSIWTELPSLDLQLGRLPWGLVEIFGGESTGKTGLLYQILAAAQRQERPIALLASETVDVPYMERTGVRTNQLPVFLGRASKDAFLQFLKDHPGTIGAVDSFTALRPKVEDPTSWNELALEFLEELHLALRPGSCALLTSQLRSNFSTPRSASRRFTDYFNVRLELLRMEVEETRYTLVVNIQANTLRRPHCYVTLPVIKGRGVEANLDLIRTAKALGFVLERGSYYYILDLLLGHGEVAAARHLEENPEAAHLLKQAIYRQMENP